MEKRDDISIAFQGKEGLNYWVGSREEEGRFMGNLVQEDESWPGKKSAAKIIRRLARFWGEIKRNPPRLQKDKSRSRRGPEKISGKIVSGLHLRNRRQRTKKAGERGVWRKDRFFPSFNSRECAKGQERGEHWTYLLFRKRQTPPVGKAKEDIDLTITKKQPKKKRRGGEAEEEATAIGGALGGRASNSHPRNNVPSRGGGTWEPLLSSRWFSIR